MNSRPSSALATFALSVNGEVVRVDADPDMPLLWLLRDRLDLKGTKYGCGTGYCGACLVLIDGEPNHACMVPLSRVGERAIVTIEGLAHNGAQPVIDAWVAGQVHHTADEPADEWIRPILTIVNSGATAVLLAELEVRYWYTLESSGAETLTCYYPTSVCGNLVGTFQSESRQEADRVLRLSFRSGAGSIEPDGSVSVAVAFRYTDNSAYDESNDYSYEPQATAAVDTSRVTLYRNGLLVWGVEP